MFNVEITQPVRNQHHYHKTEVHEHRAPTDESVKLLKEMESAALNKLLGSVKLENCPVSAVVHVMRDQCKMQTNFIIEYKLNNETHRVHCIVDQNRMKQPWQVLEDCHSTLLNALANDIALNILSKPFDNIARQLMGR